LSEYKKYNKERQIFEDAKALEEFDDELKQLSDKNDSKALNQVNRR
jgi:hypothetical protein